VAEAVLVGLWPLLMLLMHGWSRARLLGFVSPGELLLSTAWWHWPRDGTPGRPAVAFGALNPRGRMPRPATATPRARTGRRPERAAPTSFRRKALKAPASTRTLGAARRGFLQYAAVGGRRSMETARRHRSSTGGPAAGVAVRVLFEFPLMHLTR